MAAVALARGGFWALGFGLLGLGWSREPIVEK